MKRRRTLLLLALLLTSATAVGVAVCLSGPTSGPQQLASERSVGADSGVEMTYDELSSSDFDWSAYDVSAPFPDLEFVAATEPEYADFELPAVHELPDLSQMNLWAGPDMNAARVTFSGDAADQPHPGYSAMNVGSTAFGSHVAGGAGSRKPSAKQNDSSNRNGHSVAQSDAGNTPPSQSDPSDTNTPARRQLAPEQLGSPTPEQLVADDAHAPVADDHLNDVIPVTTDSDRPVSVPEPGTLGLLSLGLAGLSFARRKRAVRPS